MLDSALADAPRPPFEVGPITRVDRITQLDAPLIDFNRQTLMIHEGSTGLTPYGNNPEKPDGYAIWQVVKLESPTKDDFAKDRYEIERDNIQIQRLTLVREWLDDLRRQAQFELIESE